MTTETNNEGLEGLSTQGVSQADLDAGQSNAHANKPPVVQDRAPVVEDKVETPGTTEKEVQKEGETKEEDKAEETVEQDYVDYGDDTANSVVATLKEANVSAADAHALFKDAVESGDFSKVDLKALTEKVGKEKATLIMIGVKDYYGRMTAGVQETVDAIYNEIGGEQNWTKVKDWSAAKAAKDPAFATQVKELNAMLDLNKTAAVQAVQSIKALYEKDASNSSLVFKQVQGDSASTTSNTAFETLSRGDYLEQMKKAQQTNNVPEINRLRAQRQATR